MAKIETLKKGEFFKMSDNGRVYLSCGFCRTNKKYEYQAYDDISFFGYAKKGKEVIINFYY